MIKKTITAFIIGSMLCVPDLKADSPGSTGNDSGSLIIEQLDGTVVEYSFDVSPKITFENEDLCLTTDDITVTFPCSSLRRYYFSDIVTSVESVSISNPSLVFEREEINLSLNLADQRVNVYSLGGELIASTVTDAKGNAVISLRDFPAGIYIIEYLDITTKIIKR